MDLSGITVGFALTGSFCTFRAVLPEMENLAKAGAHILPVMSAIAANTDTRFGKAADFCQRIRDITGEEIITTVQAAEPIGPGRLLDILIIAPCTGNTLGKLAGGITDTSVTMAAKAHLRNSRPVVLAVSTNDGLSAAAKNIGVLLSRKNHFFVPFGQDDPDRKPASLVANMSLLVPATEAALMHRQLQPILTRN
ncbi:MAG: dipicolinate synthase subunit B [Clostridia bacterium]|nr:dipicolinate synthase subunit B [Clostridia bacterium]